MNSRKRIHSATDTDAVGAAFELTGTIDEANMVNVHGMRISFSLEPQDADANANGTWVLSCLPRQTTASPGISPAALELEADNPVIWGCGTWAASNQTPFNFNEQFGTSRNCQAGTRLNLKILMSGVSAGLVRTIAVMCYFTKAM